MKISWNWLSEFVDLSKIGSPENLAQILTQRGLEVEEVHSLSQGFDRVVTAQILEKKAHPQADRLSLCQVSTGTGDPLEIVCGAQNMKAGDRVALAQIGAHLPNGLKIEKNKISCVTSHGMLCSEEELKLKEKAEGILILPPETPLGKPLAEFLGLDDTVLSFKLTANRGDCLSHFGIAREVASALGTKAKLPHFIPLEFNKIPFAIELDAGELAPQFQGCLIEGVKIGPSPTWVVKRLECLGSRSINNVVDATNLVMFELGHPMHTYDADRLEGNQIRVRTAEKGEKLGLLDGLSVSLEGFELVIADGVKAVGLAGVMGGGNSEVRAETTRLLLECAEFSPVLVRRAAFKHQKQSEASHRFERGVDPSGLPIALSRLATLIVELAGGKIGGAAFAKNKTKALTTIELLPGFINQFLGTSFSDESIEKALLSQGCQVTKKSSGLSIQVPSHRLDLSIPEDLAEEVARSAGYDCIPSTVPVLTSSPSGTLDFGIIDRAKDLLVQAGIQETINLGFTEIAWLEKFGMKSTAPLLNPLSEDLSVLVPSLLPGLVKNALDGQNHHFGSEHFTLRLFELRPTFHANSLVGSTGAISATSQTETGVLEKWKLALALSGPRTSGGLRLEQGELDFFDLKGIFEHLFQGLDTKGIRFQPMRELSPNLHPGVSVEILAGGVSAGFMGLLHPRLSKEMKFKNPLWIAELDWDQVAKLSRKLTQPRLFKPWPAFPSMERDFALLVKDEVSADQVTRLALQAGKPLAKSAKIFDIYQGTQVAQGMTSIAVRVIFWDEGRSLLEPETEAASARIVECWKKELGAELRSR